MLLLMIFGCTGDDPVVNKVWPIGAVSPEVVDFGEVVVDYSSTQTFEILNTGLSTLELGEATWDDPYGAFAVPELPATIAADESATLTAAFAPPDFTDYAATLTIPVNTEDAEPLVVTFTGRGVDAPTPDIDSDVMSLDFGAVAAGSSSAKWVVLSNVGDGQLDVSSYEQHDSGAFQVVADSSFSLAGGDSTNIIITYAPTTDTGDHGSITFHSNDPDEPDYTVLLIGNGGGDYEYPVAVIDGPATAEPRDTLTLDGTGSYDPAGGPLTYQWTLLDVPEGSGSLLSDPQTLDTVLLPLDIAGTYRVALQVANDAGVLSAPAIYSVTAIPQELLHVELSWNTGGADVDLHLLTSDGVIFQNPYDCNYCNQTPNWGASGNGDDPSLDIDDYSGYGPENINIDEPADDTYYVKVHYFAENGDDATVATVRIYTYGALVGEFSQVMELDDVWDVAEVRWPDGVAIEQDTELWSPDVHYCQP